MKRKFLLLMLALIAMATTARAQVVLNETNFPDANFRAALASILGISEGDEITEAKIAATTTIDVSSKSIADLKGIEHFTALETLSCGNNQLTSLNVSNNTALTGLSCGGNQLTSLDVSKNTALTWLSCGYSQLTSLDVSKNTALTSLGCIGNQLTSLDVSKNAALTSLTCYFNQLTSLDVSRCTALKDLECSYNQLTSLDVSKNTALTGLGCSGNRLTSLDVSQNTALTWLNCNDNQLTSLDVSSKNTALERLNCRANKIKSKEMDALVESLPMVESGKFYVINTKYKNEGNVCTKSQVGIAKGKGWTVYDYNGGNSQEYEGSEDAAESLLLNAENFPDANFRAALASILEISEGDEITAEKIAATTYLDVSSKSIADLTGIEHFTALTSLFCYNNQLISLDVSKNIVLRGLDCHNNQLTSLDVSQNVTLTQLSCWQNQLTTLDVSKNTALIRLYCDDNQLCSLDVSKNTALLTDLRCSNNSLTSLDVSKNIALTTLHCYGNQLTSLDVSGCTALTELLCYTNQLTALDVSKNNALVQFGCHNNQLTSLDVSKNTALEQFRCDRNQLTSLDVSGCSALTTLRCESNQLVSLDVSKNTALTLLRCDNNQLTTFDVSKNTTLTGLNCSNNQLTSLDVSKNTALTELYCGGNQLTLLDVSKNTALTRLDCYENQLTALGVSKNTALKNLVCYNNQLTALDVSKNTALTALVCFSNQIKGAAMDALVASLPTVTKGNFFVIDMKDENEGNVCTKSQVAVAKEKGWTVYDYNDNNRQEYEGSDPVEEDIDPVDEEDNIDFGTDMNDGDDLNGNVIGDIYYNINTGDGGYDATEGCIVVKKPTDDGTVGELEGKDIFGEDFKSQFTGIVFKVPAGKGTVKVTAETTGNMLLKVKIGSNDPVEMELNGKLKVTFPYNVSETTYVYIYAGAANEAKGFGAPASGDAALKIYGIEFIRDNTPTSIDNSQSAIDNSDDAWYTIDGKKLSGEPKEKGIYIYNGKKVKK